VPTHIPVAGYAVGRDAGVLSSVGLGSCVAIALYDPVARIGAMAHVLLPTESLSRDRTRPTKFATRAVPFLLDEMRRHGSMGTPGVVARLAGGASMFGALLGGGVNMGERNIVAVREALIAARVPVVGEDVGGDFGRSVYFDIATGGMRVVSVRHGERLL
jgi:chemotaxis protein CheD